MTEQKLLSIETATELITNALIASNTDPTTARLVARALVHSEMDGQKGHGFSRVPTYCGQAKSGKVNGRAEPIIVKTAPSVLSVDAQFGFAYSVFELLQKQMPQLAEKQGLAVATINKSHHFGQAGYHVERLANEGYIALLLGNTPKAIAPWGGQKGVFGTNPIAFATPVANRAPLVIDLSLSKVARGKIMTANQTGTPIADGLAFDAEGRPTTDAEAALKGTMAPIGDAKGTALALLVEVLAAGLTGAQFGYEASSFFTADGAPPAVGHLLFVFAPKHFGGKTYESRIAELCSTILAQDGTRLPGQTKAMKRSAAEKEGLPIEASLLAKIKTLAGP